MRLSNRSVVATVVIISALDAENVGDVSDNRVQLVQLMALHKSVKNM
jgi:hypothetical protein